MQSHFQPLLRLQSIAWLVHCLLQTISHTKTFSVQTACVSSKALVRFSDDTLFYANIVKLRSNAAYQTASLYSLLKCITRLSILSLKLTLMESGTLGHLIILLSCHLTAWYLHGTHFYGLGISKQLPCITLWNRFFKLNCLSGKLIS